MINAELIHNPYLLETAVRFNGKEPRINCQIEKYEKQPLNIWVERIPEIFYNEMNGYDFELLFTGTKPDFGAVNLAFKRAGVSNKKVQVTHKYELEDAYKKSNEILQLLSWLSENRNERFDYDQFRQDHTSLFDDPYPMIVVNGRDATIEGIPMSVEIVSSVGELQNTDLSSTPIVFYIDSKILAALRKEVENLLNRDDVVKGQLFFMFSPGLTSLQRQRSIAELGIDTSQVIRGFDDEKLKKYIENFPIMEFLRTSIHLFRQIVDHINEELIKENHKSVINNEDIHARIARLDTLIGSMKAAEDYFNGRDNFYMPSEFLAKKDELYESVRNWQKKKTKVVGELEVERMAFALECEAKRRFESYLAVVRDLCNAKADEIRQRFDTEYKTIEDYDCFVPSVSFKKVPFPTPPEIKAELLKLREVSFAEKQKDLFGGIFKKADSEGIETVHVVTSYYDQWRYRVLELIMPPANRFMDEYRDNLEQYYNELACEYSRHLHALLQEQREIKEQTAAQLSGDERKLQRDNDWYAAFAEQLEHIERG